MTSLKQRTIDNMMPSSRVRAQRLWVLMQDQQSVIFEDLRDAYYAMFKDDSNFISNVAAYQNVNA